MLQRIKYSNEEFVKVLGEGSYGLVNLYKYTKSDGSSFHAAVKTSPSSDYYSILHEFLILSEFKDCPRIVNYFGNDLEIGFNIKGFSVFKLLLEYATEGSLRIFMGKFKDRKLPDFMIRDFTRMILEGLVTIHSHGYVHCDLKSDNLLIFPSEDGSYELKIADFGITLKVGEIPEHWIKNDYPFVGTPNYMPSESLHDGVAMESLDLWSLGCLVLEMYVGVKPWPGFETFDLIPILSKGKAPKIPRSLPCDAREFIQTCFSRNPVDRGSASELLSHRYLRRPEKIDDDSSYVLVKVEAEAVDLVPILSNGDNAPEVPAESLPCDDAKELIETSELLSDREEEKIDDDVSYVMVKGEAEVETETILEERKDLELKMIFPAKPPQFRKILSEFLRLKSFVKPLRSSLVSV